MTRKIVLYFLLVFASGAVVGALGYRTYNPPTARTINAPPTPAEWRQKYIDETRSRVDLTDDQVEKLKAMLDQTEVRVREEREHFNQAIRQIGEDHYNHFRTILTGDQVPKYEKLHAERVEKAKQQEQQKH